MADRRRNRRWPRQLEVRFWKQGEQGQGTRAISTNVSRTGIFVRTQQVLPSGARLRLAIGHGGHDFTVEGIVMRALRSPQHLQSVMPSGMGVRFLTAVELLEEILPSIDFHSEELVPVGTEAPSSSSAAPTAEPAPKSPSGPVARSPSGAFKVTEPPKAPEPVTLDTLLSTPSPPPPEPAPRSPSGAVARSPSGAIKVAEPVPKAPEPVTLDTLLSTPNPPSLEPAAARVEPITTSQLFPLRFRDTDQFRRVFDRDVKTGGLFISTGYPAALDAVIEVEVTVDGIEITPVRLQARVVHRLESPPGSPPGNLLAGMGVQFLDVERAVERLRAFLR